MPDVIRVKPTQDGTYTVYRGSLALVSGLTRLQAERYEASITGGPPRHAPAPSLN